MYTYASKFRQTKLKPNLIDCAKYASKSFAKLGLILVFISVPATLKNTTLKPFSKV